LLSNDSGRRHSESSACHSDAERSEAEESPYFAPDKLREESRSENKRLARFLVAFGMTGESLILSRAANYSDSLDCSAGVPTGAFSAQKMLSL